MGIEQMLGHKKAVRDITDELREKYSYVVEADIRNFFGNIDHQWLLRMLELRIKDKSFLRLINKWLKAGILDTDGKIINPITGCSQGSTVSP